ncbi:MAG: acyltransferase family protein [Oscillospiraceae bacterium]
MTKRNRAMELYRFLAAVMILCYHCHWFAFRDSGEEFCGFYLFVELFFILSGFLMMSAIRRHVTPEERKNPAAMTVRYMKKRLRQLYPHHILSWVLVALIEFYLIGDLWPIEVFKIGWAELLLVNIFGFVRNEYINIVCWYLSGLVFASLVVHYLVLRDEEGFVKILAPILLVVCYGTLFDRAESLAATIVFTRYAPHLGFMRSLADVTVGVLAFRAYEWMSDTELPGENILSTVLETAVFLASALYMYRFSGKYDFLFVPLFFAFVISVFRGKSLFTRLFDNRLSAWLGRQSYAYFLNNIVVIYIYMYLFPESNIWAMVWFCVPACLVLSLITGGVLKKLTW